MDSSPLSSRELVARLWEDVRRREEVASKTAIPYLPVHEQLLHQESLQYVNAHWAGRVPDAERSGVVGAGSRLKRRARRRLARFVVGLFADYLDDERQFNAQTVRTLNAMATAQDRIATEVREIAEAMRIESQRLADEFELLHRLLEARVAAVEQARSPAS